MEHQESAVPLAHINRPRSPGSGSLAIGPIAHAACEKTNSGATSKALTNGRNALQNGARPEGISFCHRLSIRWPGGGGRLGVVWSNPYFHLHGKFW